MRTLIAASILLLAPTLVWAAEGGQNLQSANVDLHDQASLQRGASYFVSYCMGCHSLKYMRYNRMASGIGISEPELRQNLIYGDAKPGDLMTNAMRPQDSEKWFGIAVPDLTLVTRWRTPDWVYTYLKSFYVDPTRPFGVNNVLFPKVAMPDILQGVQGIQEPELAPPEEPGGEQEIKGLKLVKPGTMKPEQLDLMVHDLVNFLTYVGEPIQLERKRIGVYVLLFLGLFFIVAYALKKEYWKDVH